MKKLKNGNYLQLQVQLLVIGTGSVMVFSHPGTPDQAITKETPMVQTVRMDRSLLQSC